MRNIPAPSIVAARSESSPFLLPAADYSPSDIAVAGAELNARGRLERIGLGRSYGPGLLLLTESPISFLSLTNPRHVDNPRLASERGF
jgi:hypothetical protein